MAPRRRKRPQSPAVHAELVDATPEDPRSRITHTQVTWQGPLPPPDALQAFEDIHPGAAGEIIAEFRAEAAHRRKQENREGRFREFEGYAGQVSAIVFALAALGVAGYAVSVHEPWIGSIVGGGVIVSGIIALRTGRKTDQRQPSSGR